MTIRLLPHDPRIPSWDLADLVERDCPICTSENGSDSYLRPDGLRVRRCDTCRAYYVSPTPSERQINDFYLHYDETHRRAAREPVREIRRRLRHDDPLADFRIQEILSTTDLHGRRCLDVGFGRGTFLHYFRRLGASPFGVETDPQAIGHARRELGIHSVTEGTVFDLPSTEEFDVVTMLDLIEHPLHPRGILQQSARLLRPGGLLLIHTPNASSFEEEPQPFALRVDLEHMQYLTLASCHYLGNCLGLDVVHLETVGYPCPGMDRLPAKSGWRTLLTRAGEFLKMAPGFRLANHVRQSLIASRLRLGRYHLVCMFRKPLCVEGVRRCA